MFKLIGKKIVTNLRKKPPTLFKTIKDVLFQMKLDVYKVSDRYTCEAPNLRVRKGKLFFLFFNQDICFGYQKEPSQ